MYSVVLTGPRQFGRATISIQIDSRIRAQSICCEISKLDSRDEGSSAWRGERFGDKTGYVELADTLKGRWNSWQNRSLWGEGWLIGRWPWNAFLDILVHHIVTKSDPINWIPVTVCFYPEHSALFSSCANSVLLVPFKKHLTLIG